MTTGTEEGEEEEENKEEEEEEERREATHKDAMQEATLPYETGVWMSVCWHVRCRGCQYVVLHRCSKIPRQVPVCVVAQINRGWSVLMKRQRHTRTCAHTIMAKTTLSEGPQPLRVCRDRHADPQRCTQGPTRAPSTHAPLSP